jgi:phosphatidylglycerol:prolipoprotein diacylglycerol transferase
MIHVFLMVLFLAIGSQSSAPYSRVAIDFGSIQIYWYAIFILTGVFIAAYYSQNELNRLNYPKDIIYDGLLIGLPLALLGARLYYVLFDPIPHYKTFLDIMNISKGGLAIHGAIITTLVFVPIFCKIKKIKLLPLIDTLMIGFLIGQIVGRFGNFMNHEAYGPAIQSAWVIDILPKFIVEQMTLGSVVHHPTFLYESAWNLLVFVFLLAAGRRNKVPGQLLLLYLGLYSAGRFFIEGMRTDSLMLGPARVAQLVSLILIVTAAAGIFYLRRKVKTQA